MLKTTCLASARRAPTPITAGVTTSPSLRVAGDDLLIGDRGSDRVFGGPGSDTLNGDYTRDLSGRDFLDGGANRDRCFYGETTRACESR